MNHSYPRAVRVAELIQAELAELLIRGVKDPRVRAVAITKVEVSPDLRKAVVYFSCYGEGKGGKEEIEEGLEGLERAAGFLQGKLGERLQLRRVPRLEFLVDHGIAYGDQINKAIEELKRER